MKRTVAFLSGAAMLTAGPAAAQAPCITGAEAESMTLVALPEIIRQTGSVCAAELPARSLVRQQASPLLTKYQIAADGAWPVARAAIVKLSNPTMDTLLASDFARPLLVSLLVPVLVGRIAPGDCPTIDRLVTLLQPLPPRNTAGIVVTTLQYLKAQKAKGKRVEVPDLPLCLAEAR